jgi:hypothetical protein
MNKTAKIIITAIGGAILFLVLGAWYAASTVDPVQLTKLLSTSVKANTGRELKIDGPVTLSFFPRISVSAERLSLGNASWSSEPEMLTLKRIELDIKTLPLLSKRIEIGNVKLAGLDLLLQKNASGKANWDMSVEASDAASGSSGDSSGATSVGDNLIYMEGTSVVDAQIQYRDPSSSVSSYQIQRLALAESGDKTTNKGLVEVKPCTFSLMYWWKGLLGYPDMIEISKDSNTAMLQFESTFGGGDSGETELTEKDVFDVDHIIEVDEQEQLVSLYSYVPIPVPEKLIGALGLAILNINPETRYGSLEICSTDNEEGLNEHFLRYRAATYLRGIKSGKVEAIESMVTNGSEFFGLALDAMCVNKSIKKWLLS